jgi:hypothetical protein
LEKKASPLTCEDAESLCQNGALCQNEYINEDFQYKCVCPIGYNGNNINEKTFFKRE